jgi:hypothetical protein
MQEYDYLADEICTKVNEGSMKYDIRFVTLSKHNKLKREIKKIIESWNQETTNSYGQKERWMDGCVGEIYNKVKEED